MELDALLRATVAIVLSGVLGWERESVGKSAGVRTHMLVGLASALFVMLGGFFTDRHEDDARMQYDPIRVVEAVVTGISFLGAGTIFVSKGRERVEGLTTAASILVTAAVGMMVGLHHYLLAAGITVLVFCVLRGLGYLKDREGGSHAEGDEGP
jgi:putative Mg2+ transporter-C (MgtC) family protein